MSRPPLLLAVLMAGLLSVPGLAMAMEGVMVHGAKIKLGIGDRPAAMHGKIMNHSEAGTTLIRAESPDFERVELHTHETDANGMMRMVQVEGYALPANGTIELKPGGDHLMLFGFTGQAGDMARITLGFANGTTTTLSVPTKARGKYKGKKSHKKGHHDSHHNGH